MYPAAGKNCCKTLNIHISIEKHRVRIRVRSKVADKTNDDLM